MASDNFNRANETPLAAPWTKQGNQNFNLVSNAVRAAVTGDSYYYYSGAASSADQSLSGVNAGGSLAGNDS
jgi:hypothetical protein